MILPTKVQAMPESRSDVDFYNADGVITDNASNMQSGKIEWNEMAVQGLHTCGRSSDVKRPRFIALQNEEMTKNVTIVETETVTASTTVTFSVQLASCTTAGFTFAVQQCP